MKKKSRKPSPKKNRKAAPVATSAPEPTRREALRLVRNGGLAAAALGGTGWWVTSSIRATAAEMDLSRMGDGRPTIVQIHDPQCAMCNELQRETRKALKCFDEDEVLYLVASIKTNEGAGFAASLGLSHVTLVLMDTAGDVQNVLQGVRNRTELKPHFEALVAQA